MTLKYIAELCQNHLGKFENIEKMVEECAYNGAKIIKLQYILAKNLSYRPVFDHVLNDGNYSSKGHTLQNIKDLKNSN